MAAYELNIKATSLADMELAVAELNARFQAVATVADESAAEAPAAAGSSPGRGRPRKPRVGAAAHPAPAAEVPPAGEAPDDGASSGDLAGGGEGGAVGSTEADQAQDQGGEGAQAAEAQTETQEAEGQEAGAAEADAVGTQNEDDGAALEDAAGRPAPDGEGAESARGAAATPDEVKAAVSALLGRSNGFERAQAILKKHGVTKPGQTPPEVAPAVWADLQAEIAKG